MKRLAYCLVILIFVFAVCACSSGRNSSYSGDYDYLWDELENSYPYLAYLSDDLGIDMEGIREKYAEEAEAAEDDESFALILQNMFSEMNNFAHLNLVTPEMYQRLYCIFVYDETIASDDDPFTVILQDPELSKYYVKPENQEELFQKTDDEYPSIWVQYFTNTKTLYLRIQSFAHELIESDSVVINEAFEKYPEAENLIIDITNNSGGDDNYWKQNLVALLGGDYSFLARTYIRKTELTDKYFSERATNDIPDDAPAWVEQLGLDRCLDNDWVLSDGSTEEKNIKKWVLTSERVYSSADKFVNFCKRTGWATIIGTRTGGDGLGSTPILLKLPDSGLLVRFSAEAGENPDGSMNAAVGTLPDVVCKSKDAFDRCLELIGGE